MDMRSLIKIVEAKSSTDDRVHRDTFLYMDPKGDKNNFAQCGTCFMFMPGKERCSIFGKNDRVIAQASCALYVNGEPTDDQAWKTAVTPKQAGYVEASVRCENCVAFKKPNKCSFFAALNEKMPDYFALNETVDAKGCCNAWAAKS